MASVNPHARELVFKLVFYGPGLGGKTTTLQYIHAATKAEHRGQLVSLATATDRTLYFDFLPIRVPRVRGMAVRLQLFTVPGQVFYAATRKLVLAGADGIVFVADSQDRRTETNQEALDDLHANLAEHNRSLEEVPHTFHWNKRDLGGLTSIESLERRFNKLAAPSLGTVATRGEGVFEGLERIVRLVLRSYDDPNVRIEASADPAGESIPQQLRGLEGQVATDAPTKIHAVVADTAVREPASGLVPEPLVGSVRPPKISVQPGPPTSVPTQGFGLKSDGMGAFSLAELWPAADRASVKQAEAMLAGGDPVNSILACDLLVTRVLASAAALVGTVDAPRDPSVIALLLGLDGARYLEFRIAVRAAHRGEPVTMRDAFEGFTMAVEARRARDRLRA